MSDGFLTRTLPFFNGVLAFLPACGGPSSSETGGETGNVDTSGSPTSATTQTTSDPSTESGETTTEDPTTETSLDSSETGTPGSCPEGSLCGSEPPDGWFGPTIIARVEAGEEAPPCPEDFPDLGPDLLADFLDAPPAVCNCECEPPAAPNCNTNLFVHSPNACTGYVDYVSVSSMCQNLDVDGFAEFNMYSYYYYNPGMCTAEQSAEIPPIGWGAQITTCSLTDAPLGCEFNGVCIPPPPADFESTWCIYQQGDVGCPAGIFNTKQVFFTGAEDTRECSDCSCASPDSSCDGAELLVFSAADCAGDPLTTLDANGSCVDIVAQSFAVDFPLQGMCPVTTAPHAMGTAEPNGEFTFCCTG